ncbi:MAG: permease-like cell division protein FtsX [Bacteroidaceae bacterium]|nr:permease-like cell division protein FtsX [Bacteroidaceae bacterium]
MKKPVLNIQTLSVYISTTLVLLLLGIMGILFVSGQSVSKRIKENFSMTVIIDSKTDEPEILKLKKDIDKKEYVLNSQYISKEDALNEAKESLGTDPMELLGENPYEAEIEINLKKEFSDVENMTKIEKELLGKKGVSEVIYHKGHIDTVNRNIRKVALLLLTLLVLLTVISWSLISNLVRLSIYSKRFLLHTMKLVGATWGFIRRPFLLHNMWIGLVAGLIANTLLGTAIYMIQQRSPEFASLLPMRELAIVGAAVIAFGIVICTMCAFLSVNRFLRMRNNDLYFI